APEQPFTYHGYYRHNNRVVFCYRIGDVEYLDSPWVIDGKFTREVAPVTEHSLRGFVVGGPAQWPQVLETRIIPGTARPFAIDTIELPTDNPWKALLFCSGHDFLADGSALVCTMQGDVWHVTGLESGIDSPGVARWKRFAAGLHQPLGLVVATDGIYVQCRDQLTRLTDVNGDGEADFYECFCNAFKTSPNGHDFICGLERDPQRYFYTASSNQGLVRMSPDGRGADVIATGFRNPGGLGICPDGSLTVPNSEGEWTPASMICLVPGGKHAGSHSRGHFGSGGPRNDQPPALPLAYLPRVMDNSSGGQTVVPAATWGPMQGQLLHFSFGMGDWFAVLRDEVDGQVQGAVLPMAGDFRSGAHRGRFSTHDHHLYVSGQQGWVSFTPDDGCFQRVRYTGDAFQIATGFHIHENGVRITFAQPVDPALVTNVNNHFAQCWNYRYSGAYGSPEYSPSHPGVQGHDPLRITGAHVLSDEHSIFVEIPDLQPVNQLHLRLHVNPDDDYAVCNPAGSGHDLFVTVHRLDAAFQGVPGFKPVAKTIAAHPILADLALNAVRVPNPWRKPVEGARRVELQTAGNLTYATRELRAKANEPLALTLVNPDVVPHNWVLVRPGALQSVGGLANQLIANPEAFARHYIPESADVLCYTDVVDPGQSQTIYIQAPSQPGRYPFLCTFPGHWMVMNGELIVQ
ncbi:MAG: heme-binding domain-containing protein, partial [Planctomycetaceae bacterium]